MPHISSSEYTWNISFQFLINCALCDGGHFSDKVIAICGGGDTGMTEALYMANIASRVFLLEYMPTLTGTAVIRERIAANSKIEVRCAARLESIVGNSHVEGIEVTNLSTGKKETLMVDGILVAVGLEPNIEFVRDVLTLDDKYQIQVDEKLETDVPGIFAAGDVRHNSPKQISSAIGDGATAAIYAERLLCSSS